MARHNDFGKKGEVLAADWLMEKGFTVLHRNWRSSRHEIDIIATRSGIVHFIEVKTGQAEKAGQMGRYGYPEERVSNAKIKGMMRAAAAWLFQFPGYKRIQYDVLAITIKRANNLCSDEKMSPIVEYFLIEDVYL
ncbi:YraN family protein [Flavitalea flava]